METAYEIQQRERRHEYGTSEQQNVRSSIYASMFAYNQQIIFIIKGDGVEDKAIARFEAEGKTFQQILDKNNYMSGHIYTQIFNMEGEKVYEGINEQQVRENASKWTKLYNNRIAECKADIHSTIIRCSRSGNEPHTNRFEMEIAECRKHLEDIEKLLNKLK